MNQSAEYFVKNESTHKILIWEMLILIVILITNREEREIDEEVELDEVYICFHHISSLNIYCTTVLQYYSTTV